MSDIDKLVENYFRPKDSLGVNNLLQLIEEQIESLLPLQKILKEGAQPQTISWASIPEIGVSEIGWSQMSTTEGGEEIPSEQRAQLLNFLQNIQGKDLQDKIKSLSDFYSGDENVFAQMVGTDAAGTIGKVMSYLVFYKTLTTIITNFNASSAGFAFESFLGVLLGGQQVPTGEGTIADLRTADGTPISLKLYAEESVEVGGSWTDLVRDVIEGLMQYVVVTKSLEGKHTDMNGTLDFYRFDFTRDNVMDIMLNSGVVKNQRLIELPVAFINDPTINYDEILPGRSAVISPEELEKLFVDRIKEYMDGDERAEVLLQTLDWANNTALFASDGGRRPGYSPILKKPFTNIMNDLTMDEAGEHGIFTPEERAKVKEIVIKANHDVIEYRKQKSSQDERATAIKEIEFADPQTSVSFYNAADEDTKRQTLLSTRGYLFVDAFKLNKTNVKRIESYSDQRVLPEGQSDVMIGSIQIGASHIKNMLDRVSTIINEKVFEIFNNVKILTTNIQAYFAGGLIEDEQADNAIGAAQEIESKTEEVKTGK
jgi:hypothetical protein